MGSLTEIRQNRMRVLRDLRRAQKALDSQIEVLERFLKRLLERKIKLPQLEDLEKVFEMIATIDGFNEALVKSAENAMIGFRF